MVKARHAREEQQRRRAAAAEAIRIRTERYGYFPGFGREEWNAHPPMHYARGVTLFGLLLTPVFYYVVRRLASAFSRQSSERDDAAPGTLVPQH